MSLTAERLRQLLHYDPETGVFTRLVALGGRSGPVGSRCECLSPAGYVQIGVDRRTYPAHRLAWLYMTGAWPPNEVDHINGVRADNRWTNLRQATRSQNRANSRASYANRSGYKGVCRARCGRWRASLRGERLGLFDTPEEASRAYFAAAQELYGEFARAA